MAKNLVHLIKNDITLWSNPVFKQSLGWDLQSDQQLTANKMLWTTCQKYYLKKSHIDECVQRFYTCWSTLDGMPRTPWLKGKITLGCTLDYFHLGKMYYIITSRPYLLKESINLVSNSLWPFSVQKNYLKNQFWSSQELKDPRYARSSSCFP